MIDFTPRPEHKFIFGLCSWHSLKSEGIDRLRGIEQRGEAR